MSQQPADTKNKPSSPTGIVISDAGQGGWRGQLKWLAPLVALVLIVVVGGLWWWLAGDSHPAKTPADQQRQQLLAKANFSTAPEKNDQLSSIVAKMQSNPACDDDPSCLYVETIYYINKGEADQANQSYDKFKKAYNPDQPLDPSLKAALQARPVSSLSESINYLQLRMDQAKQNSRGN